MAVMKKEAMDSRSKALTLKELFKVFKEKENYWMKSNMFCTDIVY